MQAGHAPAPWLALGGTVAWSWLLWGMAVLGGQPWLAFPTVLLSLAGFLGPVIVPSLLIARGRWHEPLGAFWRRCLDPRTLPLRWYAVTGGLLAVLVGLPALLSADVALGWTGAPAAFLLVGALAGAVEEPGWRGYGLVALQERLPVLAAALVVGVFWALWHLPLFLLEGTYQSGLGVGTPAFWGFHLAIVATSPIYAWLLDASGGVVFSVVLFHALGNLANEAVVLGSDVPTDVATEAAIAVVLVAFAWHRMRRPLPARLPGGEALDDGWR